VPEKRERIAAIQFGSVLELRGEAQEELAHQEGAIRRTNERQDQAGVSIDQLQFAHDDKVRDHGHG